MAAVFRTLHWQGLAASLCVALLTGCGGAKQTTAPTTIPQPRQATPIMALELATAEAGDLQAIAQLYASAAKNLTGNLRTAALVRAGELQLATGNENAARATLSELRGNSFAPVLSAQLMMQENLLDAAAQKLAELPDNIPSSLQPVTASAKATLLAKRGQLPDATATIIAARYTDGPVGAEVERIVSQFQLWTLLNSNTIQPQWLSSGNDQQRGWLELADIAQRGWQSPRGYVQSVQQWQQRYSVHDGNDRVAPALAEHARKIRMPQKVALLLPPISTAQTSAIETGLLAASLKAGSELQVFRLSEKTANTALNELRNWRADAVISHVSPSLFSVIQRFAQRRNAPPVITLNEKNPRDTAAIAFSLDAGSEARSIANYAASKQQTRSVVLAPAGPRGNRFSNALELRLAELGGDSLSEERYSPDQSDFRPILKRLLQIDGSSTREDELARLLGTALATSNRGRTDIDFVAIDANPLQAKLIQQQLNELGVTSLPIFATSQLTTGAAFELNNIRFAASPWQLANDRQAAGNELASLWPSSFKTHSAYYALGYDAHQLIPLLAARSREYSDTAADRIWKTSLQQAWINGGTGRLTPNDSNIERDMPIAEFNFGNIQAAR